MKTFSAKLEKLSSCVDRLEDKLGIRRLGQASREESTASLVSIGSESSRSLDVSLKSKRVDVQSKVLIRAPDDLRSRESRELDAAKRRERAVRSTRRAWNEDATHGVQISRKELIDLVNSSRYR